MILYRRHQEKSMMNPTKFEVEFFQYIGIRRISFHAFWQCWNAFTHHNGLQSRTLHSRQNFLDKYIFFLWLNMFWKRHFNEVCFKAYQATCNNHYNENRSKKNLSLVSRKKTKISLETLEETTKIQSMRRNQPAWE